MTGLPFPHRSYPPFAERAAAKSRKGLGLIRSKRVERGIRRVDLAYAQLASSGTARDINRDVVLEMIRARQPISRADLSRHSGLQRSTVSLIVEDLLQEGWIREGAMARLPRGRRPTLLNLNDDLAMLVCDLRPTQAVVAVVDLNGRLLSRESLPLLSDPSRAVAQIVERMKRLQARSTHRNPLKASASACRGAWTPVRRL